MTDQDRHETAVDRAHRLLIERILMGEYPIGSDMPGERTLSKELGIARNALREALQRLGHNGWLEISQGKATRVRDYLRDGNLNILIDLLNVDAAQTVAFVPDLLHMWSLLARDYTAHAAHNEPVRLLERLDLYGSLEDSAEASSRAMWQLHRALIDYCGNVAYGLIFNSFANFYHKLALQYYSLPDKRQRARDLWQTLHQAVQNKEIDRAAAAMYDYLREDLAYWHNPPVIDNIEPQQTQGEDANE